MSRISAFKNKINRLVGENSSLAILNIKKEAIILKYRKDSKVLRDKIINYEDSSDFQYLVEKEKEIILLKQEGQCKQVSIGSLEYLLDLANKRAGEAIDKMLKADAYIKSLEDKKIKNRLKKLFIG